uniref:CABIT domain-containing protein n=1 Tax=Cacopsylla melanoneura TaxID=428564 RepID=A0A8D8LU58_9HEMI
MATDGQILLATAKWSDEGQYLREFLSKNSLPTVVKIIKGQYGNLGVPTLPSPGLQSTVLLVSAGKRQKIIAQAVKLKEGRRFVAVGSRIDIPENYPGYFELLSEEGKSMRCCETVLEISRRKTEAGCLVREAIKGIVAKYDEEGGLQSDGARIVNIGEVLLPKSEVTLGKGRYLKCMDEGNDIVLLGLEQKGKFSILAKEDNISGVHSAKNLLNKRMPLTVRLVHGPPPRGLKSANHFVPELRLLSTYEEEHIFALPLHKESSVLTLLPLSAALKLVKVKNKETIKESKEFKRLVTKCESLLEEFGDKANVLEGKLGDSKALKSFSKGGYFLRRSASSDAACLPSSAKTQFYHKEHSPLPDDYDEIDQIYDYVRGFAPLPKTMKSPFNNESDSHNISRTHSSAGELKTTSCNISNSTDCHNAQVDLINSDKPEPPPIETIPSKKLQIPLVKAEKRTRRSKTNREPKIVDENVHQQEGLKLYVKNTNNQKSRLLRNKSSSPLKEHVGKAGSPLFNIRYKSLTNLQQAMELDGTLDSSNSGGRTSGDSSGTGVKLPEKRSRKLSRPRSLTNLVWGEILPKPVKIEPGVHRTSSHKLSLAGHKRIGTLYL